MDQLVEGACAQLAGPGLLLEDLVARVPHAPGLYAFHARDGFLERFPWDVPVEGRPVYVGKAQKSLHARDVNQHWESGNTGWSTVRRSLAAILQAELGLVPAPRNQTLPLRAANYGLTADSEERLTAWMVEHLSMSFWVWDGEGLGDVETRVIRHLEPPLNLVKSLHPSRALKAARARLAEQLRASQLLT
ncbi:hypothetical protein QQX13_00290 [Demequina sp. SYSU T00068]|uniref:GIY-YIG nuclease family protein n=1 Tax=Demequina lignilytica TaxID=3051663 RepID=UPI002631F8DD|nr:hypothetical protein [Demequina sp. SYSU T00068]MDN4489262.1 hypothetical protein [Demequina sp. SYSU T00068]